MKYFFILGNNPTLSVAEISAIFEPRKFVQIERELAQNKKAINDGLINKKVFILEVDKKINCSELIKTIGGTIKIGEVLKTAEVDKNLAFELTEIIKKQAENNKKIKFGISCYEKKGLDVKKLALNIKNNLLAEKVVAKWISGRQVGIPISSVTVEKNKLTTKGVEIILANGKNEKEIIIGKTLAVQPFKSLSFRDYNRPSRDDRSGMIPPKLAQIMLNLGKEEERKNKIIYDPFCGSGTILTEAILMGYKTIIGSDLSEKAVKATEENIKWITEKYNLGKINANIFLYDSQQISNYLKKRIVDVIVTEPYLGPQRGKFDINRIKKRLERLYSVSLEEFEKVLKIGGHLVMIWPIFNLRRDSRILTQINTDSIVKLSPNLGNFKIVNPLPEFLRKNKNINLTKRNTIIYGRSGQKVWREIVILKLGE